MIRLCSLLLLLSACATQVHLRDGSIARGTPHRVSQTHVELRHGDATTRIAVEDVSRARTRGHRLLYGAAAVSALAVVAVAASVAGAYSCNGEDCDVLGFFSGILSVVTFSPIALALLIRGLTLRNRDLRALRAGLSNGWTLRF